MGQVFKLSAGSALALHAMAFFAGNIRKSYGTITIAKSLGASPFNLSKVLVKLSRHGLLKGTPGPLGGYRLAKDPGEIRLVDIFEAIEGVLSPSECQLNNSICSGKKCVLVRLMGKIDTEAREYLKKTLLSDLIGQARKSENYV